ncbi:5-methylcytosine restriction system specificity protein McrC [Rhodococcus qingshengii]|uniref:5-methylcytosine restriction system specificity protein McrC n=1 Tax=Rhodococcus erythropolis TaxID=1833 RepID=UPI0035B45DA2
MRTNSQPATTRRSWVEDPWVDIDDRTNSHTYPDVLAVDGEHLWIIDAKYKQRDGASAPSRDDQYQLFAYSHLASSTRSTKISAVLVYPGIGEVRRWSRSGDNGAALYACSVPFPQPPDLQNSQSWEQYLGRTASRLSG